MWMQLQSACFCIARGPKRRGIANNTQTFVPCTFVNLIIEAYPGSFATSTRDEPHVIFHKISGIDVHINSNNEGRIPWSPGGCINRTKIRSRLLGALKYGAYRCR